MSAWIPNDAFDAYFDYFKECDRQDLVSNVDTPTDLSNSLAHVSMDAGDFSVEEGEGGDGRQIVIGAKTQVDVTVDGTTRHAVLSKNGEIRLVTTCQERTVSATENDQVNMGSYHLRVKDPVTV